MIVNFWLFKTPLAFLFYLFIGMEWFFFFFFAISFHFSGTINACLRRVLFADAFRFSLGQHVVPP